MIEHIKELKTWLLVLTPFQIVKTVVNAKSRPLKGKWTVEEKQPLKAYIDPSVLKALGIK